ncbi:hypothetical protein [Paenibacillus kandeliae]|uniref:hypothetical protein n=1 Tax=Paenibacillus kandeliae TaxID=3231269 RepID=UPI003457526B
MDWLEDFRPQIYELFAEAEQRISRFPAPLNVLGLHYLSGFDIRKQGSVKNYICYLLPFWLERTLTTRLRHLSPASLLPVAKLAALGNVMGMLHFFIQDDLMDVQDRQSDSIDRQRLVPLSQMLHSEFLLILSQTTHDQARLWDYYHRFVMEWADAVSLEKESDYFLHDRLKIAGKASPLKLSVALLLLEARLPDQLPIVMQQLDEVLIALQMNDDAADWPEDLADGSYNCLLSLIRQELSMKGSSADETSPIAVPVLNERLVHQAIYDRHILRRYAAIAADGYLTVSSSATIPHLNHFHAYLVRQLNRMTEQVDQHRNLLMQQGSLWYHANILP